MALLDYAKTLQRVPQATDDSNLMDAIEEAEGLASGVCKRNLGSASYTESYDIGFGQAAFALRQYPVTGTPVVQAGGVPVAYTIDSATGIVSGTFPTGSVSVTYTAGYTEATCPAGLRRVLYQLVGWILESAGNAGVTSEGQDGYTVQYDPLEDGVPGNLARALNPYRKVVIG